MLEHTKYTVTVSECSTQRDVSSRSMTEGAIDCLQASGFKYDKIGEIYTKDDLEFTELLEILVTVVGIPNLVITFARTDNYVAPGDWSIRENVQACIRSLLSPPPAASSYSNPDPINTHGYCPKCGAPCKARERRPNGNDICVNDHTYPSRDSLPTPPIQSKPTPQDLYLQDQTYPHKQDLTQPDPLAS